MCLCGHCVSLQLNNNSGPICGRCYIFVFTFSLFCGHFVSLCSLFMFLCRRFESFPGWCVSIKATLYRWRPKAGLDTFAPYNPSMKHCNISKNTFSNFSASLCSSGAIVCPGLISTLSRLDLNKGRVEIIFALVSTSVRVEITLLDLEITFLACWDQICLDLNMIIILQTLSLSALDLSDTPEVCRLGPRKWAWALISA